MKYMVTLQHLIHEYTELHKPVRDFELEGYAKELSRYGMAVYVRGLRVRYLDGRKITSVEQMKKGMKVLLDNEHQYRTRKETKVRLAKALKSLRLQIYPAMTFEELYTEVRKVLGHMTDLLHDDIALRIGAVNGILPKDFVYLHAGVQEGANALKRYYPQLKVDTPRVHCGCGSRTARIHSLRCGALSVCESRYVLGSSKARTSYTLQFIYENTRKRNRIVSIPNRVVQRKIQ